MGTIPQWLSAGFCMIAVLVTVWLNSNATKRMEGAFAARLDGHDKDIEHIDHEQSQQWTKINSTSEAVAKIKGKIGMNGA